MLPVVVAATHIVTGDRRHLLPLRNYRNIQIITARDLLLQLTSSSPNSSPARLTYPKLTLVLIQYNQVLKFTDHRFSFVLKQILC